MPLGKDAMPQEHQLIPQLIVRDGLAALEFYKMAFDARVVSRTMTPDGRKLVHGELLLHGRMLYVSDEFDARQGGTCKSPDSLGGASVRITLMVDNAGAAVERARAAGARVLMPAQNMFWGGRYAKIVDPFGHEWGVNQPLRAQTGQETQAGADEYFGAGRHFGNDR